MIAKAKRNISNFYIKLLVHLTLDEALECKKVTLMDFFMPTLKIFVKLDWEYAFYRIVVDSDLAQLQKCLIDEALAPETAYARLEMRHHQEAKTGSRYSN